MENNCVNRPLETFVRAALYWLCVWMEKACCLTHWTAPLTIKLGLGWCHLANWSAALDRKYNLGAWETVDKDKAP